MNVAVSDYIKWCEEHNEPPMKPVVDWLAQQKFEPMEGILTMTDPEILMLLDEYERVIPTKEHVPTHLVTMIPKMRQMISETSWPRREKFMRWLGFMQGVLWACGVYTINDLQQQNRGVAHDDTVAR